MNTKGGGSVQEMIPEMEIQADRGPIGDITSHFNLPTASSSYFGPKIDSNMYMDDGKIYGIYYAGFDP